MVFQTLLKLLKATFNYIKWLLEGVLKISYNEMSISLFLTQK